MGDRRVVELRAALKWTWYTTVAWFAITTLLVFFGWVLWVQILDVASFALMAFAWRKTTKAMR